MWWKYIFLTNTAFQADVTKELEWLKRLKDTQGEVEVNALKQVDAINNHGIYIVNGRKSTSVKVELLYLIIFISYSFREYAKCLTYGCLKGLVLDLWCHLKYFYMDFFPTYLYLVTLL